MKGVVVINVHSFVDSQEIKDLVLSHIDGPIDEDFDKRIAAVGKDACKWATALLYKHDLMKLAPCPKDEYDSEALFILEIFGEFKKKITQASARQEALWKIIAEVFIYQFSLCSASGAEDVKGAVFVADEMFDLLNKDTHTEKEFLLSTHDEWLGKVILLPSKDERTKGLTIVPIRRICDHDDGYVYEYVIVKGKLLNNKTVGDVSACSESHLEEGRIVKEFLYEA